MKIKMFEGFSKDLIDFLWELRFNNNKEWFDANRDRYIELLKNPFDYLVADLKDEIQRLDKGFVPSISISRINRDTRFSKNKEPYKVNRWVMVKRDIKSWKEMPSVFFEISHDKYYIGLVVFNPSAEYMKKFREKIEQNQLGFKKIINRVYKNKNFKIMSDLYKRKIGDSEDKEISKWHQMKNIAIISEYPLDENIYSRELIKKIMDEFKYLMPMQKYLSEIFE